MEQKNGEAKQDNEGIKEWKEEKQRVVLTDIGVPHSQETAHWGEANFLGTRVLQGSNLFPFWSLHYMDSEKASQIINFEWIQLVILYILHV